MKGTAEDLQTWASLAQALFAALGIFFVVMELRRNTRLTKVQLIAQMNDRLASFVDVIGAMQSLDSEESFSGLETSIRERILDYVSIFETIESMRQLGTLTAREIDYFFAGRFTDLTGKPGLQRAIFYNSAYCEQLYPIFSLHKHVLKERLKRSAAGHSGAGNLAALRSFADHDMSTYSRLSSMR